MHTHQKYPTNNTFSPELGTVLTNQDVWDCFDAGLN